MINYKKKLWESAQERAINDHKGKNAGSRIIDIEQPTTKGLWVENTDVKCKKSQKHVKITI